jgi:hypothetical protein
MPTKQENKTIQGKSHKNHKYNQRNAKIQGNKLKNIKKKKKKYTPIVHKLGTKNGRGIGSSLRWGRGKRPSSGWWATNRHVEDQRCRT